MNSTEAPYGDTLGLIYPLSRNSCSCNFNSTNFWVLILYGAMDIGVAPDTNSNEKSRLL